MINVCSLKRVELVYEMTCRGFDTPESVTVDALRNSVRNKLEIDSSFSSVGYFVFLAEDDKAPNESVTELVSTLETFSGDVSEGSFARASSLWAHVESRCKRMLLGSDKENVKRIRLLLILAELKSYFQCKVKEFRRSLLRAVSSSSKTVVSDDDVASADVLSDSEEEFIHPEPDVSVRAQADCVSQWNLRRNLNIQLRQLRHSSDPLTVPENTFRGLFIISIELAHWVFHQILPYMRESECTTAIPKNLRTYVKMKMLKHVCLVVLFVATSTDVARIVDDPKLSDLGRDVVSEILTILTKGVLKVAGECPNPQPNDIKLYLYTRNRPQDYIELDPSNPYQVDTNKKVIILTHGYLAGAYGWGIQDVKNAYLKRHDCNVIIVHWKKFAWGLYSTSVCVLPKIADLVGDFLCKLSREKDYDLKNIHLVGHSLGAQMSGLAGQSVMSKCQQRIGRITGLDPAGPLFLGRPIDERLDKTDAKFVDVIHTNGGVFGYLTNCGHADFYVNCGSLQFCKIFELSLSGILELPISVVACHHLLSLDYMAEGTETNNFVGIPCKGCPFPTLTSTCPPLLSFFKDDKPIMGEGCPSSTVGTYFVPVNNKKPFAITTFNA
ncbi:hypothetical protein FQA39_LY07053 [Lamprigera yunnana]|nr:hypothetical protein FQA39_LY07053 [Lamprigera yunnana]